VLWDRFELAAPALAESVHDAITRFGFVLVGTIRRDGTPRISPVEAHFVERHLMLVMIAKTQKVRDLARDSRVVLRTPITNPGAPERDVTLRGQVLDVQQTQRVATANAVETTSG
jgi:hypothetical protein